MKLTDVLPIQAGATPNAYEVLGLPAGEGDPDKIRAAYQQSVQRLRAEQPNMDANEWRAAAGLIKRARTQLSDPATKAELDVRIRNHSTSSAKSGPSARAAGADPLAGFLPAGDPLAPYIAQPGSTCQGMAVDAAAAPRDELTPVDRPPPASTVPMPPGIFGAHEARPGSGDSANAFVVDSPTKSRPRRRSLIGYLTFAVVTLGMVAVVALLAMFLLAGPGKLEITQNKGQLTIRTTPEVEQKSQVRPPKPAAARADPVERTPYDPVIGNLGPRITTGNDHTRSLASGLSSQADPVDLDPVESESAETLLPAATTPMGDASDQPDDTMPGAPPATTLETPTTSQGVAAVETVRQAIRTANWDELKSAAEQAVQMAANDEQRKTAESIFKIADLALYYRGGIQRAIADRKVGEQFEIAPNVSVVVVETSPDGIAIRRSAKTRSFTLDQLPPALAHSLAEFTMPQDNPAAVTAKWVYQAIAPGFNEGYRKQAIDELIRGDAIEGIAAEEFAQTVAALSQPPPQP